MDIETHLFKEDLCVSPFDSSAEQVQVSRVENLVDAEWESFLDHSVNGTIFQSLRFLSYHPVGRFDFYPLKFRDAASGELVAVLPGSIRDGIFESPTGASHGSFVFKRTDLALIERVLRGFLRFAKAAGLRGVRLTPPPIIYSKDLNQNVEFLLTYHGFSVEKHFITNAVWVGPGESLGASPDSAMHARCVRKSYKEGVTCRISQDEQDYRTFYEMLLSNKRKFKTSPTHSYEEIMKIKELFPGRVRLFLCESITGKAIGSIWTLQCNPLVLLAFYINHYYEYRELRSVNRLYQELVDFSMKQGTRWVDLGVSMDTNSTNAMEPSRSLIYFKECIGTRGFLRTTHYRAIR